MVNVPHWLLNVPVMCTRGCGSPTRTITPGAGSMRLCIIQQLNSLSPRYLQTLIRPSWYCRQKRALIIQKIMLCHSYVHLCRSVHHCKSKHLWFFVKGIQSNRSLADISMRCKRRRTIREVTNWCVRDFIRCVITADVTMPFISAMRPICLCSRGVMLQSDCNRKLLMCLFLLNLLIPYSQNCYLATSDKWPNSRK